MQPLIMITLIGVAAAAMGTGFLTNSFDINVQQLAVNETDLVSPVSTVNVDFVLSKAEAAAHNNLGNAGAHTTADDTHFHNFIDECRVHTPQSLATGAVIICKLTDDDRDVVAEGKTKLIADYTGSNGVLVIKIDQTAYHFSHDVQEVHDVKIVVLGNATDKT